MYSQRTECPRCQFYWLLNYWYPEIGSENRSGRIEFGGAVGSTNPKDSFSIVWAAIGLGRFASNTAADTNMGMIQ